MKKRKARSKKAKSIKQKSPIKPKKPETEEPEDDEQIDLTQSKSQKLTTLTVGDLVIQSPLGLKKIQNSAIDLLKNRTVGNYLNIFKGKKMLGNGGNSYFG